MMFETIKEFEDYIFSIETEEQLQHAKFGEADVLAYYESLGDRARAQIYKDLSLKSGKESVLNKKYDFQEMAKGFMENLDDLGSFFASIGEKYMPEIHRNQLERYPLVRTILSNYQNLNDTENALLSMVNDIGTQVEIMPEISDEKIDEARGNNEKDSKTKEWFQKFKDVFKGFKSAEKNNQEHKSELNHIETDFNFQTIINSVWFHRAVDKNFIVKENNQYKWLGTKGELALFAELLSEKMEIKSKWKTFEELFGEKRLASAKDRVTGNYGSGTFGKREKEVKEIFGMR